MEPGFFVPASVADSGDSCDAGGVGGSGGGRGGRGGGDRGRIFSADHSISRFMNLNSGMHLLQISEDLCANIKN